MLDQISPTIINNTESLHEQFDRAQPFRHVVLDQFFCDDFCARLQNEFPAFDRRNAMNENGEVGGKAVFSQVAAIGPSYAELDQLVAGDAFRKLISTITGIDSLEYDPHYFGGGTHENLPGQDLDPHVDFNYHPISGHHRRLNLIVYFNQRWETEWGGTLDFHRNPRVSRNQDEVVQVLPLKNRCVIFETTEQSWHGFTRIAPPPDRPGLTRRSFALYYYSLTRPEAETANPHSTIYIDRPLPERLVPGMTLDGEALMEIRRLIARRDQHLQRLYGQIQQQMTLLEAAKRSVMAFEDSATPDEKTEDVDLDKEQLTQRVEELQSSLGMVLNSSSWRMTAPLRALRRRLQEPLMKFHRTHRRKPSTAD